MHYNSVQTGHYKGLYVIPESTLVTKGAILVPQELYITYTVKIVLLIKYGTISCQAMPNLLSFLAQNNKSVYNVCAHIIN